MVRTWGALWSMVCAGSALWSMENIQEFMHANDLAVLRGSQHLVSILGG